MDDFECGLLTGAAICSIFVIVIALAIFVDEGQDAIYTDGVGKILCAEQGLEYSHREIIVMEYNGEQMRNMPKIYCVNESKKLIGGIVVMGG